MPKRSRDPLTLHRPMAAPTAHKNPLLSGAMAEVDLGDLTAPAVHARPARRNRRRAKDLRNEQSAAAAIADFDRDTDLVGLTCGRFSLLHLIGATLAKTGPAHFSISTWTAADYELRALHSIIERGDITGTRWLIDFSMCRREPATTQQMRELFGWDSIRVAQVHAKFCLFQNADWRVVCRSSMNLNQNPRTEDFELAHDPELCAFYNAILDETFSWQPRTLADDRPYAIIKEIQRHQHADD